MTPEETNTKPPVQDTLDDTKVAAADGAEKLKSGAHDLASKASADVSKVAQQAQESAADEVSSVASALRTAAEELRHGSPQERTFSQLANGLADASEAVRDKDLGEIVGDLNAFARRNPLIFLGGAALLGFAATRFAKASETPAQTRPPYDRERRDGSGRSEASSPTAYRASNYPAQATPAGPGFNPNHAGARK
ncbi:hypothetical protein [Pseudoruegeria sp. SK021]|uniref:hypothetical protein n=1 Tax=Pseudoruegeria sp. SK021 TaxID=1933035 RepID=UPI000A249B8B|nr:hypothetical protein [Pseudoruegeria sp. SK021]OSP52956.1 hypothetical protein BV911_18350 [Pseudoruegeria sp. SK021]